VSAIEHADFDGVERLALVTGGESALLLSIIIVYYDCCCCCCCCRNIVVLAVVSTFDHPELVKLGTCESVEEVKQAWLVVDNILNIVIVVIVVVVVVVCCRL
jgi:T-complex protein 1 subunit beta